MANPFLIALGKTVRFFARLRASGAGGGSALPGLVVERISPHFAIPALEALPHGVVVISGTNGKTTTTKIVAELLSAQGLRVFTNTSGSNYMRGVISSMLKEMTLSGHLHADIAVLELDEAYAVGFVRQIHPRYSLITNVMHDQLDRFGDVDHTADLLAVIAANTTNTVVLNREDSRLAALPSRAELTPGASEDARKETLTGEALSASVRWYGLAPKLLQTYPQDGTLNGSGHALVAEQDVDVMLSTFEGQQAVFTIEGTDYKTELSLKGMFNAFNSAGALALVRAILDGEGIGGGPASDPASSLAGGSASSLAGSGTGSSDDPASDIAENSASGSASSLAGSGTGPSTDPASSPAGDPATLTKALLVTLSTIRSAFGRGESVLIDGRELELILVKNPGGFRLSLESFDPAGHATMIAINDLHGDGRDISWLYDVSFESLKPTGVAVVSGIRAYDMALRLAYDEVIAQVIECDLAKALDTLLQTDPSTPCRIYCSYTVMLDLRKLLAAKTQVGEVSR